MTEQEERELNKRIAKALGYTLEENGELCTVTSPDGTWRRGYHPDQYTSVPGLGNWVRDTDAALALALSDDILGVDVNVAGGEVVALVRSTAHGGTGYGDTYAIAICRAWLAWKENQSSQK